MIAVEYDPRQPWLYRVEAWLCLAALRAHARHERAEMDRLLDNLDRLRPALVRRRRLLP